MTADQGVQLLWGVGAIVLVASALSLRRIGLGPALKMIATWLVLFGIVIVAASYRTELGLAWNRVMGELGGQRTQVVGGELRVPMAADGHFWIEAQVDGTPARFLVDSGATITALSPDTVRAAALDVDEAGFPVLIQTANGQVAARRLRIRRLTIGPIVAEDIGAITAPAFQDFNVVGMNFLSQLRSWRVEGRTLILVPDDGSTAPSDI